MGHWLLANHWNSVPSGEFDQIAMGLWAGDHIHDVRVSCSEQFFRVAEMLGHMKAISNRSSPVEVHVANSYAFDIRQL